MNAGKYILIGFLLLLGVGVYNNFIKSPDITNAESNSQSRYFSGYDSSNPELVQYVKKNMYDSDSFQHLSTIYSDNGNGTLRIVMDYSETNSAGLTVKSKIAADFNMGTRNIKVVN